MQEPRAPYAATAETEFEKPIIERLQVQFPPYFDRFLEERDRRLSSELARLEEAIEHNSVEIGGLLREMNRRFAEAKEERESLRAEIERHFAEVRAEMDRRFAEAKKGREFPQEEMQTLRAQTRALFHWVIGLELFLLVEMLVLIVRVFLVGTF